MSLPLNAVPAEPPAGGAALDQVIGLSVGTAVLTAALLWIAYRHRTGQVRFLERVGTLSQRVSFLPSWTAVSVGFVAFALLTALLGFLWDVSLHAGRGRDDGPLANPAHYLILIGLFSVFIAGMTAIVMPKDARPGPAAVRITRTWYAPVGGLLLAGCGFYALIGFPLDDIWHRLFGQDVTLWGPTHLMLIGGAGFSTAGILILVREGLAQLKRPLTEVERLKHRVMVMCAFGGLLIGLSVFPVEYDFGIQQFRLVLHPMLLVAAAGIPLVAARLYAGAGAAIFVAMFALLLRGIVAFIVGDVFHQADHVFPFYLGMAVVVELIALSRLKDRPIAFGAASGIGIGTVGLLAEGVWVHYVFQFDWGPDIWVEAFAMALPVAVVSAVAGALFAMALQGRFPAKAPTRAFAIGGVLVVMAATANGLITEEIPEDATASFVVTEVGTPEEPAIMAEVTLSEGLVDERPAWVQITAWQGGGEGVVVDHLERIGDNTYRTTRPIPVLGTWKTVLRVHDGRLLTAAAVYLPEDPPIEAEELPYAAQMTRDFQPEIEILQRERSFDHPAWIWNTANLVVLACSLLMIWAMCWGTARLARRLDDEEARAAEMEPLTGRST